MKTLIVKWNERVEETNEKSETINVNYETRLKTFSMDEILECRCGYGVHILLIDGSEFEVHDDTRVFFR